MAAFQFELVSPEKLLFSGNVDSVVVPGAEGEFTVLAQHAPMMAVLKPGVVRVQTGADLKRLFVRGGFAEVSGETFTILAEQAIPVEDLDAARLDADIRNAEEDAADATNDEARRVALERVGQLREVRAALGM